jgi:hypothetical protein
MSGKDENAYVDPMESIDFSGFIISLGSNVLFHLGLAEQADGEKGDVNLPLAKQTIGILAMLEAKTAGNLNEAEEKLLSGVLYQIRLSYVEVDH